MSKIASIPADQSTCLHARAGAYLLAPMQALALHPKETSRIRITCGSAWVTINDGCDYFLTADQEMAMPAGSRVVMESMQRNGQLMFDWQPVVHTSRERSQLRSGADARVTETGVSPTTQALRDLRGAVDLAARGLTGLAAALATGLARGLERVLGAGFNEVLTGGLAARARSAHSSARAAHGRMASCESIASSGAV